MTSFGIARVILIAAISLAFTPAPRGHGGAQQVEAGVHYVYLIRHGQYDHDDTTDSRTGKHLVALGHEQARLTGERLAKLPVEIATFVSSEYTRARETADDIGEVIHRTPARDALLNECTPASAGSDTASAGGKTARCDATLREAWAKYMRPSPDRDTYAVLVCHGNVIRWFVSRSLGGDGTQWRGMNIGNASITAIAIRADGSTRVATFSDVGHLPPDKQTWTGVGAGWQPMAGSE